jgi:hypothetical protein
MDEVNDTVDVAIDDAASDPVMESLARKRAAREAGTVEPDEEQDSGEPTPDTEPEGEEEDKADEPEAPAIKPPVSWDAEAQAEFAQLPPVLQAKIAEREAQREKGVSQAMEQAAAARRAAEAKVADITRQVSEELTTLTERTQAVLADRWEGIDWVALAQADPLEYTQLKAQYEAETAHAQRLAVAQRQAEQQARAQFLREQQEALATLVPEMVDPKTGPEVTAQVGRHAVALGIPQERLADITAMEARILYRSWKLEQLESKAKERAAAPPKPATAPSAMPRGGAAPVGPDKAVRALERAKAKAQAEGTPEAIAAFMSAKRALAEART